MLLLLAEGVDVDEEEEAVDDEDDVDVEEVVTRHSAT